jgi:hypothetical protein
MLADNPKLLALTEINNPIKDEHILTDALRNMYQFVVVCRSEMLHLFMVDVIYRNTSKRDEILIKNLMIVAKEIQYQGFIRALNYQPSQINPAQNYIRRLQSVPAQRRMACIIQLETLLEQLNSISCLPNDCTIFIKQVDDINKILITHNREELGKIVAKASAESSSTPTYDEVSNVNNNTAVKTNSNEIEEDDINCYQVWFFLHPFIQVIILHTIINF